MSWTLAGSVGLTEGIKFLYGQIGDLLKKRREQPNAGATVEVSSATAEVLDAPLRPTSVDVAVLDGERERLLALWQTLAPYAGGLQEPNPSDQQLLERVAAARALLEVLIGQHVTFQGENRPATGSPLPTETAEQAISFADTVTASGAGAVAAGGSIVGSSIRTNAARPSREDG